MPQLVNAQTTYLAGTPISTDPPPGSPAKTMTQTIDGFFHFPALYGPESVVNLGFGRDPYTQGQHPTDAQSNQDRLATLAAKDPTGQIVGDCAWWNLPCKAAKKVSDITSSAGSFISSTLTKVLVIMVVVAVIGIFVVSFAQAKAVRLAA